MYSVEQIALLRELVAWACGLLATLCAVVAGAVQSGWLGAFTAAAAGFTTLGGLGAYANKPAVVAAPKA